MLDTGVSRVFEEEITSILSDTNVLDRVLADLELEAGSDRNAKAVKDNKAKAPTYMWNKWTLLLCALVDPNAPCLLLNWKRGFRLLREAMLRFWKRSLLRGFAQYRRSQERLSRRVLLEDEVFAAWDCFVRIGSCTVTRFQVSREYYYWRENHLRSSFCSDVATTPFVRNVPQTFHARTLSRVNLYHNWTTGRAVTGTLHFLNGTPINWFSKRQNTVETATYGSEFVAARIATNQVINLRLTL